MEWLQVMFGLLMFVVLAVYMTILMIAVYDTVTQLPELQRFSHLLPTPGPSAERPATLTAAQALTVLAAAFGLFFPRFRDGLARAAAGVLALLEEQVSAVRNDPEAGTLEKARCIGYLAGVSLKAIEAGDLAARLEAVEATLKARRVG